MTSRVVPKWTILLYLCYCRRYKFIKAESASRINVVLITNLAVEIAHA